MTGLAGQLLSLLPFGAATDILNPLLDALYDNNPIRLLRGGLGVAAVGVAWRLSRLGRLAEAGVLGAFAVPSILRVVALLPGFEGLRDATPEAMGLIASVVVLLIGILLAIQGRLTRHRAESMLTVLLLVVLYPHRNFLGDPTSTLLAFSAPLMLLFASTWRVLTGADFTRKGSPGFPQPTRVLLYLANSLVTTTLLAFIILARASGTGLDTSLVWGVVGDDWLGEPLFVMGLVAGLWLGLSSESGYRTRQVEPSSGASTATH
ncbi:MAG: hypothetical protein IT193_15230 [Propionibacteriaceae bacterium]|nr:hypothetical protein [Propionibacteriaceae bacterium]